MATMDRKHLSYGLLLALALALAVAAAAFIVQRASATPWSGVTPMPIATGDLESEMRVKFKDDSGFGSGYGVDTITMVKFIIEPGGVFGWHQHAGPVWAVVAEGALTLYDTHDPTCQGETVSAGGAFLDEGPNHTHNARNLGDTPVVVYATFMLPEGGSLRLDQPDPGVCPF